MNANSTMSEAERFKAAQALAELARRVMQQNAPDKDLALDKLKALASDIGAKIILTPDGKGLMLAMETTTSAFEPARVCEAINEGKTAFLFEIEFRDGEKTLSAPTCGCGCGKAKIFQDQARATESFNKLVKVAGTIGGADAVKFSLVKFERVETVLEGKP